MKKLKLALVLISMFLLAVLVASCEDDNPRDPGVRGGAVTVGGPRDGLSADNQKLFAAAQLRFQEVVSVSGKQPGSDSQGLGPRFNGNSCAGCHIQPTVGGTSPALNPQIAFATVFGGKNIIPSFIRPDGPIREVRFIKNPDGSPDGGVHDLFVITGMPDAGNCQIVQPNFYDAMMNHNLIFRIPTPTFGLGLVEEIKDANLLANLESNGAEKRALGIAGRPNRSGNDGTITRFGWKAQNKSLLIFAGEAYNVEQGVTNRLFPQEREDSAACQLNPTPEDVENFSTAGPSPTSDLLSDTDNFAHFMRLSAPPIPVPFSDSAKQGQTLFATVGCANCHTPSLNTGTTSVATGQSGARVDAYSDFMLHHMGKLADGISQGSAGPDEFRTAPLWGAGQRIFFLHDGRTSDLLEAIRQHSSNGSEATKTVERFNHLTNKQKQAIIDFLRSL